MKMHNQKNTYCSENYEHAQMQKEMIIQKLKDKGIRMTRQRLILLDIILEAECCSCKEIYYKAVNTGEKIGLSTVYRLVNILEEIGAISRKNMYKIVCSEERGTADMYTVEFDDGTVTQLSGQKWNQVIRTGLKECGYMQGRKLRSITQNN